MPRKRKTIEEFIAQASVIHNNYYSYGKSIYVDNKTKVIITCPIHGDFEQTPMAHLRGQGCPKCGTIKGHKNITFSTEQFIEKAKQIHKDYYDYSKVNYINKRQKVLIICPIHGEFWQEAGHHMQGHGCPRCNQSKGELLIEKYLSCNNIPYIRQYSVDIDTSINPTGYAYIDFYLPDFNCFIEYNGIQHYTPQEHFGGQIQFNKQKSRDLFIKDYCENNNIDLLEIKYDLSNQDIINTIEKYLINNGFKLVET